MKVKIPFQIQNFRNSHHHFQHVKYFMKELLFFIQNILLNHPQNPYASPEFYLCQSLFSHLFHLLMGINMNNCTKFIHTNSLSISKELWVYEVDLHFPWWYQGAHREQQKHWSCIYRSLSAERSFTVSQQQLSTCSQSELLRLQGDLVYLWGAGEEVVCTP